MDYADNLEIRPAILNDINNIIKIEKKCFNEFDRFKVYQLTRFIKNPKGSIYTDVIIYNKIIIGWAAFFSRSNSNFIRLYSLCITPEFSGKGIASIYLKNKIEYFKDKYKGITLEVRISNQKAINLYKKFNFQVKNIIPKYYSDGEDAYKMILYF